MKIRSLLLAAAVAASLAPSSPATEPALAVLQVKASPAVAWASAAQAGARVALARRRGLLRRTTDLVLVGTPSQLEATRAALGERVRDASSPPYLVVTVAYSTGPKPPEKWWDMSPPHPFDPGVGMQRYSREVREVWDPARLAVELPVLEEYPAAYAIGKIQDESWGGHVGGYLAHLAWTVRLEGSPRPLAQAEVEGVHKY